MELNEIAQILNDTRLNTDQVLRLITYKISNSEDLQYINIHNINGDFIDSLASTDTDPALILKENISQEIRDKLQNSGCTPGHFYMKSGKVFLRITKTWMSGQKLQGYFRIMTEITGLSSQLKGIIHNRSFPRFDSAYVMDKTYNVIASSQWNGKAEKLNLKDKKMFQDIFLNKSLPQKNIGLAFDHRDGKTDWLVNINTVPQFNWLLVTLLKKGTAYESLYSMQKKIIVVAIIFIFIAGLAGAFFGRKLSAPILKIAKGARIFAENNFKHRINGVKSGDEIEEVADAFNFLGESLEQYDSRIKKEVAIRSDLSRYLTPELVESVIERKADLSLGGKKEKVAVLFADIAGFTSISESKPPEQVVSILNELFTILTGIIFRNKGMVDKFIGDSVMALFGIPNSDKNAPDNAVNAAKEMITWLEVGNKKWKKELGIKIKLSIAVNYGEAIIGNIGSEKRMEFTAIGDVINTAAKIEKIALADQILITEDVYEKLNNREGIKPLGEFKLPGHESNAKLFEIL